MSTSLMVSVADCTRLVRGLLTPGRPLLARQLASTTSSSIDTSDQSEEKKKFRLDVAIVGAPNAGKSQLLNSLTGSNVAAVSRKRHTTRDGISGVKTLLKERKTQLVFLDTPGFLTRGDGKKEGMGAMQRQFSKTAFNEIRHADYTLLVVDAAKRLTDNFKETLVSLMLKAKYSTGRMEESIPSSESLSSLLEDGNEEILVLKQPKQDGDASVTEKFAIVLNKVDLVKPKERLLEIAMELGTIADECILYKGENDASHNMNPEDRSEEALDLLAKASPPIFYISALHNDGVDDVLDYLEQRATPSKSWVVSSGHEATDASPLERIHEVIREKVYRCLHREVPHAVQQVNRTFQPIYENNDKRGPLQAMTIHQDLVIRTKSHKRLLLGKGGRTLNRIQSTAQADLQAIFKCKVYLHLHVKQTKSNQLQSLDA